MKKSKSKKVVFVVLIILVCLILGSVIFLFNLVLPEKSKSDQIKNALTNDNLVITNLNVGKSDACFIQCGEYTGIIDTGTRDQLEKITGFLDKNEIKSLDFMVLTHYDKDHIGCAKSLIEAYEIKSILVPAYEGIKEAYIELKPVLDQHGNVKLVDADTLCEYGSLKMTIYPATDQEKLQKEEDDFDNNMSLVVKLNLGNKSFLFAGDIETAGMNEFMAGDVDLKSDWIKMPHHGNHHKGLNEFLDRVSPSFAVISTSKDEPAEEKTLNLLEEKGIRYFITSHGDITTISDGQTLEMLQ